MSYIDKSLIPGEHVIYRTRLHWIVMVKHVILALLMLGGGAYLVTYALQNREDIPPKKMHAAEGAGVVLMLTGLVTIVAGNMRRDATEMAVTNRRVVIKTGMASRTTIEILLQKVESIEITESSLGRMLGYGSIVVIGTGGTSEPFRKVAHPLEFRSHVQQQIEKLPGGVTGRADRPA